MPLTQLFTILSLIFSPRAQLKVKYIDAVTGFIEFDASKSKDIYDNPCTSFVFDFGDGTPTLHSSSSITSRSYHKSGTYKARVFAFDIYKGYSVATAEIDINITKPSLVKQSSLDNILSMHTKQQSDGPQKFDLDDMRTLDYLQQLWRQSKDVNIKNIGKYLQLAMIGYKDCVDYQKTNQGYVKFGTYCRQFCEATCKYLLGGKENRKSKRLHDKINKLSNMAIYKFPFDEMMHVKNKTNKFVHSVDHGKDCRKRYLNVEAKNDLMKNIVKIAEWIDRHLSFNDRYNHFSGRLF